MRQARHLHPEWGFLAPPPSFSRTLRIFVIASIVGATAGSGVILSLADRAPAQTSVVADTLVASTAAPQPPAPTLFSAQVKPRSAIAAELSKAMLLPVAPTKPVAYSRPPKRRRTRSTTRDRATRRTADSSHP